MCHGSHNSNSDKANRSLDSGSSNNRHSTVLNEFVLQEKTTKMNAQTIAMTLSPVLQMSHRLLLALLFHCKALFPETRLTKYVPPLPSGTVNLPDSAESIAVELAKQESLLLQIHMQMNAGFVTKSREEQLWEVQRIITQLKV